MGSVGLYSSVLSPSNKKGCLLVVAVSDNKLKFFYMQGDVETLKKYCSPEVIDRCKAERTAYHSHGIFFDNKVRK